MAATLTSVIVRAAAASGRGPVRNRVTRCTATTIIVSRIAGRGVAVGAFVSEMQLAAACKDLT
jgi:hypothetical protein